MEWFAEMARRAAKEFGLSFNLAKIYAEIEPDLVVERLALTCADIAELDAAIRTVRVRVTQVVNV